MTVPGCLTFARPPTWSESSYIYDFLVSYMWSVRVAARGRQLGHLVAFSSGSGAHSIPPTMTTLCQGPKHVQGLVDRVTVVNRRHIETRFIDLKFSARHGRLV